MDSGKVLRFSTKQKHDNNSPAPTRSASEEIDDQSDPVPSPTGYQVFLSFSGADHEMEFADLIYQALVDAGILVLKDHYELDAGWQLHQELLTVIEHCKISIPILSRNYVRSARCLQEMTWMLECRERRGDPVVEPIFYDIRPYKLEKTVARIFRSFSHDLNRWEPAQIIQHWRDVLAKIRRLKGWYHHVRNQGQVIEHVVAWITGKLRGKYHLPVSDSLVGIDDQLEAITGLLDLKAGGVKVIGIYGSAGIGKTTLVKAAYNLIVDRFEDASFLDDLEERCRQPRGLEDLQAQLLTDLSTWRGEVAYVREGSRELRKRLVWKKVLIVLDGVADVHQVDALVWPESLGPGSRIIITGRDTRVLERSSLYEVTAMHSYNAFLLFCKHAFRQDSPQDEFASISWEIAKVAGGNPFSIEVAGSSLYGKSKPAWEATLKQLRKAPYKGMLRMSLDKIDDEAREMFLDIACFFVGMDVRLAMYMWDDGAERGIRTLQKLSLIKIGDDKNLWMPNHLRDLGREIVRRESAREPGGRSRLWGEDALDVIKRIEGTDSVQAICLDYGNGSGEHEDSADANLCRDGSECVISSSQLESMAHLRLFDVTDAANLSGDALRHLSSLRWFGWHGNAIPNIPSLTYPENLFILDLSRSAVNETWDGWSPNLEARNLKALNLTSCHQLARTPNFSSFPYIEMLVLKDCTALSAIDTSIGHLKKLKSLDLRNCASLEKLLEEIGFLSGLEELLIDGCPVREIPISKDMRKLRTLSAKSCRLLTEIPKSIGALVGLEELLLDDCEALTKLPTSIGELDSIKVLSLSHARVVELPDEVGKLSNLELLNIDHCPIKSFPSSLGKLERLEVLNASGCLNLSGEIPFEQEWLKHLRILRLDHTGITSIPESIVGLSRLHTLDLEGCVKLLSLPELPSSLINLKVTRTAWEAVPNRTDLIKILGQLDIRNCGNGLVQGQATHEEVSSSSSVPIQPGYEYEVFLSFRGPDTRKSFTDSLYCSLDGAGIRTFRDNEELRPGEAIGRNILEAIEQSRVSIPIFSTGYASSKWCLMEVAKMMDCMSTKNQKIIPIFYDVTPYQVRRQTGNYATAFSMHEKSKKISTKVVKDWRNTLAKVGELKGWDMNNDGYHGKVIIEIVSEVLKHLKKPYLDVTEHLVGVEDHMEKAMKLLKIKADDVKVVGICGMGGIGKTTLAKFIYNQLRDEFEYCSFLKDIREASLMSKGLESLQSQLVSDVLRRKCEKIANTDAGKAMLRRSLRDKKVLLLLDDVDQDEQINNLVEKLNWLGRGSRIIITARRVDALHKSEVFQSAPKNNASIYKVEKMHPHSAFLLFCKYAFRQDLPLPHLASISSEIVEATGRLPLAIVTIGSHLSFQTNRKVWEEALESLKTRPDILDKLKISYDVLSRQQQEVFLDIACLFPGTDRRIPVHVWKTFKFSPETTIEDLLLRSLIRIGDNSELLMHDLYRELGREIIRRESKYNFGKQSRLWCSEDAVRVLQNEEGTKKVKAITLEHGMQSETCCFSGNKFRKLSNVWFLGLGNANLDGNFQGRLLDLRWLSHHGFDFLNIPDGLNLKNLVVLDLSRSNVSENWNRWNSLKEAEKLEVLNLTSCHQLTSTPNFPSLPRMKRLILEDCRRLATIGPSVGKLKALEFLDLRNCSSLEHLPKELSSLGALTELLLDGSSVREIPLSRSMENLEIISAKSCRSLTQLPWSIDLPLKLTKLFLDNCEAFTVIPDSIGQLQSLTDLSLSRTSTIIIPESIGNLCNLELFNIDHCPVRNLPHSLWRLEKLEVLSASGCLNLVGEIPAEIGDLLSLRILGLKHTNVSGIPPTIGSLPSLHTLDLMECKKIKNLPNLPCSLVSLRVTCTSSVTIPNLPDLINLLELEVLLCGEDARVAEDIEKFSKIEKFTITFG